MVGASSPRDCCTRNGLICSCSPHSQGHSAPALAEGCSFRLPPGAAASLLHREVDAGDCRQIPPGPQGCWPCWLTAKALPVLAPQPTQNLVQGTACRVQRPGPLGSAWITSKGISGPELPLGSAEPPLRSQFSCFSLPSSPSQAQLPAARQCPCCQSPENVA